MVAQALVLPDIGIKKLHRPRCFVQKAIHSFTRDFAVLKCVIIGKTQSDLCRNLAFGLEKCRIF